MPATSLRKRSSARSRSRFGPEMPVLLLGVLLAGIMLVPGWRPVGNDRAPEDSSGLVVRPEPDNQVPWRKMDGAWYPVECRQVAYTWGVGGGETLAPIRAFWDSSSW